MSTTINIAVAAGTDDGVSGTGSGYNTTSMRVGAYFGTANFWSRHPATGIPGNATILTATFTGDVLTSSGTGAVFRWYGVKELNPSYPTNSTDFDARSLTTAFVAESRSGTGSFTSSSLVSIIQEIVNQSGFSGGAIMLYAKEQASGGFDNNIAMRSFDLGGTLPTLNITYDDPVVGVKKLTLLGVG